MSLFYITSILLDSMSLLYLILLDIILNSMLLFYII